MPEKQLETLAREVEWLKDVSVKQGEKLVEIEIRLNKKHEEIVEIKHEENKKRERELQFLENMTRTSALLDKVANTVDSTQREINKIKEDVDYLMNDSANRHGAEENGKYLIGLFLLIFGGVITYVLTNMLK